MTTPIAIGDTVTWTHTSKKGRTVSMTTRQGVVTAIDCAMVTVRKSSGKTEQIAMHRLRRVGGTSELTELVTAVFESNRRRA